MAAGPVPVKGSGAFSVCRIVSTLGQKWQEKSGYVSDAEKDMIKDILQGDIRFGATGAVGARKIRLYFRSGCEDSTDAISQGSFHFGAVGAVGAGKIGFYFWGSWGRKSQVVSPHFSTVCPLWGSWGKKSPGQNQCFLGGRIAPGFAPTCPRI